MGKTRRDFCNEMNQVYVDHGMYVGTGNGELTLSVAGQFFAMERNYGRRDDKGNPLWYTDTARDYEYLGKCYRNGWDMSKSRAGDCSGQIVGAMRRLEIISKTADYRARDFQDKSRPVELDALTTADFVYDKKSNATHVGVYDSRNGGVVYESKGRDAGFVCRKLSEGSWVVGGRLDWFSDSVPVLTRDLKYIKGDLMKGDDVMECQERLHAWGYLDDYHGKYGKETKKAVMEFQEDRNITADELGIVGQVTWAKLYEV